MKLEFPRYVTGTVISGILDSLKIPSYEKLAMTSNLI